MDFVPGPERIIVRAGACPVEGQVRWAPAKSLWIGSMALTALILGPLTFSPSAFALFLLSTGITLCFGHSVGMHRRLIHSSFACPTWLEHFCVYLGTLVGMAGPIGMIRAHDFRDWAQRQSECHDFFCHRKGFWQDCWWQLHCELQLASPPAFRLEPRLDADRFYRFVEATWMLQQVPWAVLFYACGGWGWLIWGICVRVSVSVTGHWLIGYLAHREGGQAWIVEGAAVQGYDVAAAGLISMGESWHNNHHAFPGSARLGLYPGQVDLGWLLILAFEASGLAWNIRTPEDLPWRGNLRRLPIRNARHAVLRSLGLAQGGRT